MQNPKVVKLRAKKLRNALSELGCVIKHSDSLEVVSKLEGFLDWNSYSAYINKDNSLRPIPSSWSPTGDCLESYEIGCDVNHLYKQIPSASIRSKEHSTVTDQSMATLMQSIKADGYVGRRVKLSAKIKAIDVVGAVTIWFRVDGKGKGNMLAFDNLEKQVSDGVIRGTTDWEVRSIILDVPMPADRLHFGFYLRGQGAGFAAAFSLQSVGEDVPTTHNVESVSSVPRNLNFQSMSNQSIDSSNVE